MKHNLESITLRTLPHPELDPLSLGHNPDPNTLPRLQHTHATLSNEKTRVQNTVIESVLGFHRAYDDVVVGCLGESESVGFESKRHGHGLEHGFECGELDSTEASGLPLLALGGDFEGED